MGELTVRMTGRGRHVLVGSGSKFIVDLLIVPRRQVPLSSSPSHARAPKPHSSRVPWGDTHQHREELWVS